MTASQMIEDAAVGAGLATEGRVNDRLKSYGLKALNRVYPMVWDLYPINDNKFYGLSVPVEAGTEEVTLPADVDVIRGIRLGDRCLTAVDMVSECEKGWFWTAYKTCETVRYVGLPNDPTTGQRVIKLIPAPPKDATMLVHGIRRCIPLTADSTVLLPSARQVIFHYLVAEFYDFNEDRVAASDERKKANEYFKCLQNKEETLEQGTVCHTPGGEGGLWE